MYCVYCSGLGVDRITFEPCENCKGTGTWNPPEPPPEPPKKKKRRKKAAPKKTLASK